MCIEKHLSLFAKSEAGYIKHLESLLLDSEDYKRCYMCERVQSVEVMIEIHDGDNYICEGACEHRFDSLRSRLDDEADLQYLKGGI